MQTYGQDWSRLYTPDPLVIVKPANTQQVAEIIKLCNLHEVAIVPSGGRTGLSGGAVATNKELVLSLERLNQISDFNPVDRTVNAVPGLY